MSKSELNALSEALAAAVEKAGAATVLVDARRRYPASGIAYAADLALTADHVVTRDEEIRVGLPDGGQVAASVAGRDPGSDLAVLRLSEPVLKPAQTAKGPARVGQIVVALGRPSEAGMQASWGIVSAVGGPVRTWRGGLLDQYLQTEATPYPGFSGGPLIDANGEVLGLNTSGLTRGAALTIPVGVAWPIAKALAEHGHVKRGYLGVRTQPVEIPAAAQKALGREQSSGLLALWLENGGPAERGGLMVGDILVAIGSEPVADTDELFTALGRAEVGKPTEVEVLRGGQPQTLKVTIGERT